MKGKIIEIKSDLNTAIKNIIKTLVQKKLFDAVFVPVRIPSRESFAYLLIKDKEILESITPLPPTMPVQGARALKDLTRLGKLNLRILCIMRPCEIRAAVELAKLRQITLQNLTFFSFDCPGVFPTAEYIKSPEKYDQNIIEKIKAWQEDGLRPNCSICVNFSHYNTPADLHIGFYRNHLLIYPVSKNSQKILDILSYRAEDDLTEWENSINTLLKKKKENRSRKFSLLSNQTKGIENLEEFFTGCINCHNCMRVCPICYCRQCFFESPEQSHHEAEEYLARAKEKGGIRFPPERMVFHLGRMNHMALSCVGCGSCEDGCPMDVPVGQIFSFIGNEVQKMFDYLPGKNLEEPIPLLTFKEDELHEYEDTREKK